MPNTPRVQDNERVERRDFEFATDTVPQAYHRALGGNFLTNPAGTKLWIVSGFNMTNPAAKQLRVDRGVAILNAREEGQTVAGMLAFEGDTQKTVDLNAYAVGTYGIWIRFELADGEFQNRIFWNPTGLNEFTQSMATRRVASWGVRVEPVLSNPGADWFKIGEVAVAAGPPLTITKQRKFYFEGDEAGSYAASISDDTTYRTWGGGANDRNADRATYGVRDLQTMLAAIREQLRAMQGSNPATPWYGAVTEGLNRKVSRFGDSGLAGNYLPDASGRDLGSTGFRWDLYASLIDVSAFVSNALPDTTGRDLGSGTYRWDAFLRNVDAVGTFDGTTTSLNWSWVAAYFANTGMQAALTVFDGGLSSWVNGVGAANNLSKAALQLLNDSDSVGAAGAGAVVPITFRLGSSAAQRDGFDLFAFRNADDDPRLRLQVIVDEAVVDDIFEVGPGPGASSPYWSFRSSRVIYGTPTGSTKNTAYANTMIARNVPKAWGTIRRSGANTLELVDGFNIAADPTFSGSPAVIDVAFASYMASSNYAVVLSAEDFTATVYVASGKNGTGFTIVGWNQNTGLQLDMDTGGNMGANTRINFAVYGLN